MKIKLQKWGNSIGIRISRSVLKPLNPKENYSIFLKDEEDRIIITKSLNKNISLLERFNDYKGNSLAKEFVWDEPKGKEIW